MSGIHDLLAGAGVGLIGGLTSGFMGTSPGGGLVASSSPSPAARRQEPKRMSRKEPR